MKFVGPVPYNGNYFHFMGVEHIIVLLIIAFLITVTILFKNLIKKYKNCIRNFLGITLVLLHLLNDIWLIYNELDGFDNMIPLHLSSISTILLGITLTINNKKLFDIFYFWSLAAGIQATIVPEMEYGYNHIRFYLFFLDHGLLFYSPVFMLIIYEYRLTYKAMWRSYFYLFLYAVFVMITDFALDVNYMILKEKPKIHTPLDYMGDWPYYLLFLVIAELGVFHILYLFNLIRCRE